MDTAGVMMNRRLSTSLLMTMMLFLFFCSSGYAGTLGVAEKMVLEKAQFWEQKGQHDNAIAVLKQLLLSDPAHPQALTAIGIIEAHRGNDASAKSYLDKLQSVHPDDSGVISLKRAIDAELGRDNKLTEARRLAGQGKTTAALDAYRQYFGEKRPPEKLALEYYQVASTDPQSWTLSKEGFEWLVRLHPANDDYRLALAKHLTTRSGTRIAGIRMLGELMNTRVKTAARERWKKALTWLPNNRSSMPYYRSYLDRAGEDKEIRKLLTKARVGGGLNPADRKRNEAYALMNAGELSSAERGFRSLLRVNPRDLKSRVALSQVLRTKGYAALNSGDLASAGKIFRELLRVDRRDADANAGLGLVLLKQKSFVSAEQYLGKAIEISPNLKTNLAEAYDTARYLGTANKLPNVEHVVSANQSITIYPDGARPQAFTGETPSPASSKSTRDALQMMKHHPQLQLGVQAFIKIFEHSRKTPGLMNDLEQAVVLQERAIVDYHGDAWARLNLARLYHARGKPGDDRRADGIVKYVMRVHPNLDSYYASAIYFSETAQWDYAAQSIHQIPIKQQTRAMRDLASKIEMHQQVIQAVALATNGRKAEAVRILDSYSDNKSIDSDSVYLLANAWKKIGESLRALQLTQSYMNSRPAGDYGIRLFYASLLSDGKNDDEMDIWLRNLDQKRSQMTVEERVRLDSLSRGYAVRASDRLRSAGESAAAWEQLAPYLSVKPVDLSVQLALARIYHSAHRDKEALQLYKQIYDRQPNDPDVIEAYTTAAIGNGDFKLADRLILEGRKLEPGDQRFYILKGDMEKSKGDNAAALRAYRQADYLNETSQPAMTGDGSAGEGLRNPFIDERSPHSLLPPGGAIASPVPQRNNQVRSSKGFFLSRPADKPSRQRKPTVVVEPSISSLHSMRLDRLTDKIEEVESLRSSVAAGGLDITFRSGESGLSQLNDLELPMSVRFTAARGRVELKLTPVLLNAGSVDLNNVNLAKRFGTNSIYATLPKALQKSQSDAGLAMQMMYSNGFLNADFGVSPLGFNVFNFVGGLGVHLPGGDGFHFDLDASRRSVTESLLSYAGQYDAPTGSVWGGVTNSAITLGVGQDTGDFGLYAKLAAQLVTGFNVKSNTGMDVSGGGYSVLVNDEFMKVTLGAHLDVMGYRNNLRFYTFGHGGYFSPQQYFAMSVPVNVTGREGDLIYKASGYLGLQAFQENSTPYFPNDPLMQSISGLYYPSQSKTGILFGISLKGETEVSERLSVGMQFQFDNAKDFKRFNVGAYMKYWFGPRPERNNFEFTPLSGYHTLL